MIEIRDLSEPEAEQLMAEMAYGHLGCADGEQPYVVPINYAFSRPHIYFYTTEGKKTQILDENPLVCLQIEHMDDEGCWRSVVANGLAIRVADPTERDEAVRLVLGDDVELLPAAGVRWENGWIKSSIEAVYKIVPTAISGRYSTRIRVRSAFAIPGKPVVAN